MKHGEPDIKAPPVPMPSTYFYTLLYPSILSISKKKDGVGVIGGGGKITRPTPPFSQNV